MPTTDNTPSEDSSERAPKTATPSAASARAGGRPGVSQADAVDAIDTWIARTGKPPSIRELRSALGNTGSLSTLSRYLHEHSAERLLAGEDPALGSAEQIMAKAVNAALALLAAESAMAADEAIAVGAREADARITAAEAVKQRAVDKAQGLSEARERALGEVSGLQERVESLSTDLTRVRAERDAALTREAASQSDYAALDTAFGQLQTQRDQLQDERQQDRDALDQLRTQLLSQTERVGQLETLSAQHASERDTARALHAREQSLLVEAKQRLVTISAELKQEQQLATREHEKQARTVAALTAQVSSLDAARQQAETLAQTAITERDALQARESMFEDLRVTMARWSEILGDNEKSDALSTDDDDSSNAKNQSTQ